MPFFVCVKSVLDRLRTLRHRRSPHPQLHILEHPLDHFVEALCPDLATNVSETEPSDSCSEALPELTPIIRDQELRCGFGALNCLLNQHSQFFCRRTAAEDLHGHDSAAEAVDNRCDLETSPQQP